MNLKRPIVDVIIAGLMLFPLLCIFLWTLLSPKNWSGRHKIPTTWRPSRSYEE